MPKAPKNWRKVGYMLPEVIEPEENICVCVPIPKDWGHIRAFLGQLTELSKWQTWEKDGTTNAALTARRWFDIAACVAEEIDCAMANKGCGCTDPVGRIYRHNPETDRLEQSDDGGATWENAPDPRYDSALLQPIEGATIDDVKCISATNAMSYFKDELIAQASTWTTFATVVAGIITVVIGLLTGGLGAALAVDLAATFINAGIGAVVLAFTPEVYDRFKCNLYCHANDDGSWNEADLEAIKVQIDIDETGAANSVLKGWIDQLGTVGLTNSGRLNLGNEADCTACGCGGWCYRFDFTLSQLAWVINTDPVTFGKYTASVGFQQNDDFTPVDAIEITSPSINRVLTNVKIFFDPSLTGSNPNIIGYRDGFTELMFNQSFSGATFSVNLTEGLFVNTLNLDVDPNFGGQQQWTGTIVAIELSGTGTNPFGTDNCL